MRKIRTRIGSILLSMVLVLSLLPATALAEGKEAQIGDTTYDTLAEAVRKAQSGQTITLLKNIDNSVDASGYTGSIKYNLGAGVTLDGNGYTISGDISISVNAAGGTIQNVNFKDIHNNAVPTTAENSRYNFKDKVGKLTAIYGSGLTGKMVVTGCSFDGFDWEGIQITPKAGAEIVITDNTFTSKDMQSVRNVHIESSANTDFSATVTRNKFYNGIVLKETALEVYYPANISKVNLSGNFIDKPIAVCILTGSGVNNPDLAIPFANEDFTEEVSPAVRYSKSGNFFYYLTLSQAFEAGITSLTIVKDVTENVTASVASGISLSCGNYTFTGSIDNGNNALSITSGTAVLDTVECGSFSAGSNSNVTIKNGSASGISVANGAVVTIQNGQYTGTITNNGTLTITGGTFSTDVTDYCATGYKCDGPDSNSKYTVQQIENALVVEGSVTSTGNDVTVSGTLGGSFASGATITDDVDGTNDTDTEVDGNDVTVDLTTSDTSTTANTTTLEINAATAVSLGDAESLTLKTDVGDVSFDGDALSTIAKNADDTVTIQVVKTEENTYQVSAVTGNEELLPTENSTTNGTITISVPYTLTDGKNVIVFCVDGTQPEAMKTTYIAPATPGTAGTLTWETPHLSTFMNVEYTDADEVVYFPTNGTGAAGTLADAVSNSGTIYLVKDVTKNITIPVGADITIDGQSKYSIKGQITCTANGTASQTTNLTLQNLTMDGDTDGDKEGELNWAVISQNQGTGSNGSLELKEVNALNLTMTNCTVQNYVKKGIYLTNAKNLTITGCTFGNNATADMPTPNTFGDYTIDLNLCAVQDTVVTIQDTIFTESCGKKAAIKVAARGGASDIWDDADVPNTATDGNVEATVSKVTITGCTFKTTENVPDVNIGTDSKADSGKTPGAAENSFAENTTGAYEVVISGNKTTVTVFDASQTYKSSNDTYCLAEGNGTEKAVNTVVPIGYTLYRDKSGNISTSLPTVPDEPETPSKPGSSSSSGSSSSDDDGDYSVSVPASTSIQGGSITVSPRSADKGDTVTITVKPDDGYVLDELTVTTRAGAKVDLTRKSDTRYTFTMPAGSVVIDVSFVREDSAAAAEMAFTDVAESFWAYSEIQWAFDNGYMTGTSATTFNPGGTVNRQQVWMILARMAGADPANMAEAKSWAVANGISDGTNPTGAVTRQQLVALLYRFAAQNGYDVSNKADLSIYPDAASVASYAAEPMAWAVANGIIGGTTAGTLNAAGNSNRAQLAVILWRFYQTTAG